MSAPTGHPDVWNVAIALVFIAVGVALAASLLFLFIDAPMVMIGVELLSRDPAEHSIPTLLDLEIVAALS